MALGGWDHNGDRYLTSITQDARQCRGSCRLNKPYVDYLPNRPIFFEDQTHNGWGIYYYAGKEQKNKLKYKYWKLATLVTTRKSDKADIGKVFKFHPKRWAHLIERQDMIIYLFTDPEIIKDMINFRG